MKFGMLPLMYAVFPSRIVQAFFGKQKKEVTSSGSVPDLLKSETRDHKEENVAVT
jgi:hypothetical protein